MEGNELKPCWKCGGKRVVIVNKKGKPTENGDHVTCFEFCMKSDEIYTVSEWQSHPRPATRAQLVAALQKARKYVESSEGLGIVNAGLVLSEIDSLLEGE